MDAAVAALLGAAIGAVVPAVTGYVAHRAQGSRDLLKSASELGLADWKGRLAFGEKAPGKYVVWPLQLYVSYHAELLRLISKDELTAEKSKEIRQRHMTMATEYMPNTGSGDSIDRAR